MGDLNNEDTGDISHYDPYGTTDDLNGRSDDEENESFFTGVYEDEDRQWWVVCPNPLTAVSCSTSEKTHVYPSDSRWGKWKKVTYTDKLSKGTIVTSPHNIVRACETRNQFSCAMLPYLRESGKIVDLLEDAVRMEINGARMLFDLDLFPKTIERVCPEGSCSLEPFFTSDTSFSCTSCLSQFGEGTPLFKCNDHTHTLCLFCCGLEPGVKKGMKVFRGPTWLWKDQDGGEYKQGTVEEIDSKGQVGVRWDIDSSSTKWYRGPPFCDVVAAYDGKNIVPNTKTAVKREASSKMRGEKREKTYIPYKKRDLDNGFHFTNLLPSVRVNSEKKTIKCVAEHPCSVYIEEVLDGDASCSFKVTQLSPSNGKVWFGLEAGKIGRDYRQHNIGEKTSSLALLCTKNGCFPINGGKKVPGKDSCEPMKNGDVVTICVLRGEISFYKNKKFICGPFELRGGAIYKFGASVGTIGDSVTLVKEQDLPRLVSNSLDSTKGYHLIHSTTGGGKVAVCSGPSTRTYVTEEVLDSADLEERAIHFKVTMQERVIVGISGQELMQGREGLLGNQPATFALVLEAGKQMACFIPSGDNVSLPAKVKSGDVVSVVVKGKKKGAFVFMLNGALVNSYHTVKGPYRFGVSLDADGDRVEVLDNRKGEVSMEASVDVLEEYYFSNVDTGATILDNGKKAVKKTDGAETLYTTCVIEVGQEKTIHFIVEEYLTSFAVGVCGKVTGKGALGEIGGSLALHITRNSVDAELKYGGKTHPMKLSSVVSPGDQFSVTVAGGSREGTIVFGHMGNTYDSEKGVKGTFRFAACSFSSGDTLCISTAIEPEDSDPSFEGNTMFKCLQLNMHKDHKLLKLSDFEERSKWEELGRGGFGTVFKSKYCGKYVAVKVQNNEGFEEFSREVRMTEKLKRIPCAVEFIGIIQKRDNKNMIVMKYYPDGDLHRYVLDGKLTKREDKYRMMHNLVKGLEAMTNMKIVHRDLKPGNILIDDGKPVIADLGMAKNYDSIKQELCGTPCYVAPEVWVRGVASEKSDVYSCAMIFYFIFSRGSVFPKNIKGANHEVQKKHVVHGNRPPLECMKDDKQSTSIIEKCWANNPENRPTFAKLLTLLEAGL
eukprot:TRINITY_DN801_c0_g2_i4.p1 TRINITY_DN801_c0_g2~~TRINITY_DN801_c0_g2_i4.p1  ORF type:complete len:1108 (+),score=309.23 TRINITY_DN801_c0_g2_i4:47-3370(+)